MGKLEDAVWIGWPSRAEKLKKDAGLTDADLAAEVSELVGHEVGRALVNHWFRGRRDPSVREFIGLCSALGADPGHVLLNVQTMYKQAEPSSTAARVLQQGAPTPEYLKKSAKRLKRAKPVRIAKQKVRT